ncbi:MAG TPA: dihydrolipoamide acetyltransferase family protein [Acidimicrobiia bacterium]|nr:dihydrolipoamide acetyltransferase family protein [Acidimicrobiia bacterium]
MPVTISMPQLGETVTEGTILEWVKQVGDHVAEDEVIVEISTDKVDTEVPSPASGILTEILVAAGETVAVGTALAVLGDADDAPAASEAAEVTEAPAAEPPKGEELPSEGSGSEGSVVEVAVTEVRNESAPAEVVSAPTERPATSDDAPRRGVLSPVVRKLASEHGIDLDMVQGSGDGGRITRKDVEAFAAGASPASGAAVAEEPPSPAPPTPQVAKVPQAPASGGHGSEVRDIPRMRQRIAANLRNAKDTAAHVWTSVEVDFENVERVRQRHRSDFKAAEGYSLTYLPFIARATMDALSAYPVVNSRFELDAGTWTFNRAVNLGIAVDLDQDGLVVVNIRDADAMTLKGLARSIRAMAVAARDGKAVPDDLAGFSFSITNPGPFGSFMSAPIIPVPNAAILSTDTVTKKPVVVELPDGSDAIAIRHIGYLGLSWDHRVFDGSTAVLFLDRIKKNLQEWDWEQELS